MPKARTIEEAQQVYREIRNRQEDKSDFDVFEGRRFFRFGNSWHRRAVDQMNIIFLDDDSDSLVIVTPFGRKVINNA